MRPIVIGNWKTNKIVAESCEFIRRLRAEPCRIDRFTDLDVVLTPTLIGLEAARCECEGSVIRLGAQNVDYHEGSFCGGFPARLLKEYCEYCFVGHSEQRLYYGDTDEMINKRLRACTEAGLVPIFCTGESRGCFESGRTTEHLSNQLRGGLKNVKDHGEMIILYEPIWALGTGLHPDAAIIEETIGKIREMTAALPGMDIGKIRFIYAGSINPDNAAQYASLPSVDGLAVGSASLDPLKFAAVACAVSETAK